MKYNFSIRNIIRSIIIFFHLCTLYEKGHFTGLTDKSTTQPTLRHNLIEFPLYRKKESPYYFYYRADGLNPIGISKPIFRANVKTNIRETDKYFIKKWSIESTNEDGDHLLQAEFGVSKPKPWRKDDDDYIEMNANAEIAVDTDRPESPNEKSDQNLDDNQSYKFQIGKKVNGITVGNDTVEAGVNRISMPDCGKTSTMNKRVVNGKDALPGAYPWIVSILKSGESWCGGAIINEFWILTAAHCFMGSQVPQTYAVRVGTINRNIGTTYRVEKLIVHERFHLDNMFNSDIALLKVDRKIKMGKLVNAICLPRQVYEEPQTKTLVVTGWGQVSFENKELPVILQEVVLNRLTIEDCARKYKVKGNNLYYSQTCTWDKGQDACQGDSGSPALEWRNQIAYHIGIVSYGSTCADELPGVYTKVSYFLNWIVRNVESN